ncbi:FAD-binding oxidoreductase [Vibrio sp. HN007]|uniref:FAD-binding oxidoreductase n=1 Tax=Vibrio iocasae TaxID=3098914 RepID=UPI0035D4E254
MNNDNTKRKSQDLNNLIFPVSKKYEQHLSDASYFKGYADTISFPNSTLEVSRIIKALFRSNVPITVQGARTGLTGAAVPNGGHIMSMQKMNKILGLRQNSAGDIFVHVEPGLRLAHLHKMIANGFKGLFDADDETKEVLAANPDINDYFWPVDLLEGSATIGGIAGTNASGVTSYMYGRAANHIEGIRFIGESGSDFWVSRKGNEQLESEDQQIAGTVLFTQQDLLNAILGGEGMYGVITELALKLRKKPKEKLGLLVFVQDESQLEVFVDKCQDNLSHEQKALVATFEVMDQRSIEAVHALSGRLKGCPPIPDFPTDSQGAAYIELHGDNQKALNELSKCCTNCISDVGVRSDSVLMATDHESLERLRALRYAAPRVANLLVELNHQKFSAITKLFTDIRFEGRFSAVFQDYLRDLQDMHMPATIYGQVLDNHLHVNLFPEDERQLAIAKRLLAHWAQKVRIQRGKLVGNHGIGKLKTDDTYPEMPESQKLREKQIKAFFDQRGLFNPHNRTPLG